MKMIEMMIWLLFGLSMVVVGLGIYASILNIKGDR